MEVRTQWFRGLGVQGFRDSEMGVRVEGFRGSGIEVMA